MAIPTFGSSGAGSSTTRPSGLWAPPNTVPQKPWTPNPSQMATMSGSPPKPPPARTRTPLPQTPYEETWWDGTQWRTQQVDPSLSSGGGGGRGASGPTIAGYSPSGGELTGLQQRLGIEYGAKGGAEVMFQRQMDALDAAGLERLKASMFGESSDGGSSAPVNLPGPTSGAAAAAQAAAFARAKDRTAKIAQGGIQSVQDEFAGRGLSGSPLEGGAIRDVMEGGVGQLGEASRDIALEESRRAQDVEDRNIQASLTQRGQDIGERESRQNRLQALFQAMKQRNYLY